MEMEINSLIHSEEEEEEEEEKRIIIIKKIHQHLHSLTTKVPFSVNLYISRARYVERSSSLNSIEEEEEDGLRCWFEFVSVASLQNHSPGW